MTEISRRTLLVASAAAGAVRALHPVLSGAVRKPILRLVYDKSRGAMRAIDSLR